MKTNIILFSCFLLILTASCKSDTGNDVVIVKMGALLDLTGDYSETGNASKAAIGLSIKALNRHYTAAGSLVQFACSFEDTKMDTSKTISAVKKMYDSGIRLLVAGPNTSAELKAIKPFVDSKQMVVLNSFSTAPALAIPDDFIFRLLPDDNVQGQALVKMMQFDSIKVLIPIWREDAYGTGLYQSVKQRFENAGCTVMPGIGYQPGSTQYSEMISSAVAQVISAVATYGNRNVGILLISYQEAVNFLNLAAAETVLSLVKWYGCDTNVQRAALTADPIAAEFAETVHFMGPIMSVGTAGMLPPIAKQIMDEVFGLTGVYPDSYCLNSYDAVQIFGLSYNLVQACNTDLIRTVLPSVCESYNYVGLSRKLNDAGDLETANFIFWTVKREQGGYVWDSYATYMADGDYILFK
ncbi:MAG: ABC transporter substrate-binding protein [Bacteroidia bacterium]|nr:ABC transporter substrate-binding protein [Bacteroidia bacterium]